MSKLSSKHIELLQSAFRPLDLNENDHPLFFNSWEEIEFNKGDFLVEAGKIERRFYVVIQGTQMVYLLNKNGDKQIIGFSFDGSFSGIYDSFLKERPSHYFLEALTPSKLLWIDKAEYDSFFENYPEFDRWGRIAHQELLIGRVQREVELITLSAKERFDIFMKRCPEPLKQIPQKHLASYLNMTPETFSRLRREIS